MRRSRVDLLRRGGGVLERAHDRVGVVHAAAPDAAAGVLQRGPQPRVGREVGVGRQAGRGGRLREDSARPPRPTSSSSPWPTRSTLASRRTRSMTIWMRSPSRTLPIGPPASASGPTWPMQAPVETPEKRASVRRRRACRTAGAQRRRDLVGLLHAGADRPAADEHEHVARRRPARPAVPLIAAMAALSRGEHARRARSCDRRRRHRRRDGSIAVLLMTEPSGARLPRGNVTVRGQAARRARASGVMMTSSGSTPSRSRSSVAEPLAALGLSPTSRARRRAARR